MWVFALNIFLCPIKKEHIAALSSQDIPLGALLNRPMVGELMASKLVDISDQAKDRLEPRMCEAWQKLRDSADSSGITTIVTVVIFKYLGTEFFASYNPIFPGNFVEVRRQRELARNAQREFPDPVRHIDRWLRELKDSKGGKLVAHWETWIKRFLGWEILQLRAHLTMNLNIFEGRLVQTDSGEVDTISTTTRLLVHFTTQEDSDCRS
ncbi:hypothetical protein GALMADRAFT_223798 [Galerina marginata CBS 339.88]|uniref:Uncharacterized protein n=1 Tax=Galerina marginata (strain CBS 339.88) TaxID=685588 RepID=A0A067T932_GALM3|nr:hypothetical protein GALMADRAFT_223798 [Galerina marginata CBS 339.88]